MDVVPKPKTLVLCDLSAEGRADAATVDALARLCLAAKRRGCEFRVRNASSELRQLIAFTGLSRVLGVEAGRQPEEREQRLGVEEERHLDDAPA